jgi:hypothetical protein
MQRQNRHARSQVMVPNRTAALVPFTANDELVLEKLRMWARWCLVSPHSRVYVRLMKVAAIHGIGNRFEGYETIAASWLPALNSGLKEAGFPVIEKPDFIPIFFGSIFRPSGVRGSETTFSAEDEEWVREMLLEFNREAARLGHLNRSGEDAKGEDPRVQPPGGSGSGEELTRGRTPQTIQAILKQLSKSRFFKALGPERLLLADLREVRRYLHEPEIKAAVLTRFEECIHPETRVLVGHSLGSVVAYEGLCKHPEFKVDTLVTLGSPLGIRNLVFDELTPKPSNGQGAWPNVRRWVNIADKGDIVALQKELADFFGPVEDVAIYNGWVAHDVRRYLTAKETGQAIGQGLKP